MKKRVLVAEDDASVAFLIKDGLIDLGAEFEIDSVASGEQALEKIKQGNYDVLVTDQRMPGISGLKLIETIKAQSPATPSILMTGFGSEQVEMDAQRLNVYHYMTKPFPLADLKRVIEQALAYQSGAENIEPGQATQPVFKITLGGQDHAGKTALIKRFCTGKFDAARVMTVGVDFHLYDLENLSARVVVWDVLGQPHFTFTRRAFYRGSQAVGLVYDVTDRASFERLPEWYREIRLYAPTAPFVIAGNKSDLGHLVSTAEGMALARSWNAPFFETSCLTGENVPKFFQALAQLAMRGNPS